MGSEIATKFVLLAIQEWGQSEVDGRKAVQDVLDAAGFKAVAASRPVFGGIWPKPATGEDSPAATAWLRKLTDTMPRGRFQDEVKHVEDSIASTTAQPGAGR